MSSYNNYMKNEYTRHKYASYEERPNTKQSRFEVDETIGIFLEDKPKLNKALIPKDTSELTKAFFKNRNEQQQAERDNQLECDAYYAHKSPRQFKNGR